MSTSHPRFISFDGPSGASFGVLTNQGIVDLGARVGSSWPSLRHAIADGVLLRLADLAATRSPDFARASVKLRIPIPNPEKIICVGLNYPGRNGDHPETFKVPSLFVRFPNSLSADGDRLLVPHESEQLDYEGEIAIVIGKTLRRVSEKDALDGIAGLTLCNEGLITDWMHIARHNVTQGKNFDRSGSMGPWIVPFVHQDQIDDIELRTFVNNELRQSDRTSRMLFSVRRLISYISTFATLIPGDIISTGSPMGKGAHFDPSRWLRPGDTVRIEADGIGTLSNRVEVESAVSMRPDVTEGVAG